MPDLKISELPAADALDGTELVPVVQLGTTKQTTAQDIANLGGGGGSSTKMAYCACDNVGDFISGTSHPGIDSVTWSCAAPGLYQINFTAGYFGSPPAISMGMIQNEPRVGWEIVGWDQDIATIQLYEVDTPTNAIDMPFTFMACGVPAL